MEKLTRAGEQISRYGLVFILLIFGIFKFTATEAHAIKPFIDHSPFFSWMMQLWDIRTISAIIGCTEIIAAVAIGLRFLSAKTAYYGSLLGAVIFLATLSFLFSTPGMFKKVEWLWIPDGFIIKDLLLLGFCLYSAGEAYNNAYNIHPRTRNAVYTSQPVL